MWIKANILVIFILLKEMFGMKDMIKVMNKYLISSDIISKSRNEMISQCKFTIIYNLVHFDSFLIYLR